MIGMLLDVNLEILAKCRRISFSKLALDWVIINFMVVFFFSKCVNDFIRYEHCVLPQLAAYGLRARAELIKWRADLEMDQWVS